MADQVDFPNIYIDASAAGGGDGSQSSPYNSFSQINWTTGGDNSIFDYYAGTPTASVTINLKRGEVWRGTITSVTCSTAAGGTEDYPIWFKPYGTGDNPLVDGSILLTQGAPFKWTPSSNWTSSYKEYYLEAATGGNPGLNSPRQVFIDGVRCGFGVYDPPNLEDHGFVFGDYDSLGYETIFIRDESGDPDTSGVVIDASVGSYGIFFVNNQHIRFQGIDTQRSNGHGIRLAGGTNGHHVKIFDCNSYQDYWGIGGYAGANYCELNSCDIDNAVGAAFGLNGSSANPIVGFLMVGCSLHDTQVYYTGGYAEAAGMKIFAHEGSIFKWNTVYNNPQGGFRLDGLYVDDVSGGCNRCEIFENLFYNNGYKQIEVEFSEENSIHHNYIRDPDGNASGVCISKTISNGNMVWANICANSTGSHGFENRTGAGSVTPTYFVGNLSYNNRFGFMLTSIDGAVLRNNIAKSSVYADIGISEGNTDEDSDYNCFSGDGLYFGYEYGVGGKTFTQWKTYTGHEAHTKNEDPLLTDPGNGDFTLQAGSPCIGAADDTVGSPYNIGLLPGSTWPSGVLTADRDDY